MVACAAFVTIHDSLTRLSRQMRDVATSETFREVRWMKRRRPRAFWVQGLRPARRYAIEFEGVSNRGDRTGERPLAAAAVSVAQNKFITP